MKLYKSTSLEKIARKECLRQLKDGYPDVINNPDYKEWREAIQHSFVCGYLACMDYLVKEGVFEDWPNGQAN